MKLIEIFSKFCTFWIPNTKFVKKVRNNIKTYLYGYKLINGAKSIGKNFICRGSCSCSKSKSVTIGNNCQFNGVHISGNGKVTFGNYVSCGVEILIISQNHNYEGEKIPYDETYIYKDIEIGNFVWLGSRVMILPGTKIGEGAIIQGGAVVHGEIPPYAIAGGNPAKVFKYRNIEHFKKLKDEEKFFK